MRTVFITRINYRINISRSDFISLIKRVQETGIKSIYVLWQEAKEGIDVIYFIHHNSPTSMNAVLGLEDIRNADAFLIASKEVRLSKYHITS